MKQLKSSLSLTLVLLSLLTLRPVLAESTPVDKTNHIIRLATTTSTENSGLLTYLLPEFEKQTGYSVHVIAVGTGKALRMGRDGDADVLLVHAPAAEIDFIKAGYGNERHAVMYNDFVLVGPVANPANIKIDSGITRALQQISQQQSIFISRGDNSGTHKKELGLWQAQGIKPQGKWYREVGQGMGKVLQMAAELDAYTLTDRGTWLAYKDKSPLNVLNQGDPQLFNPYHIIAVNHQVNNSQENKESGNNQHNIINQSINHKGANALISWITSTTGQSLIGQFTLNDNLLFKPSADTKQLAEQAVKQ